MADRQMDRETDRPLCMALRAPQGRWTDGQTDHSASLCRHHLGDRWTDRPGVSERPDGQTDRQTAAHCPASSQPPIVCPQAPSCGRCSLQELKWEGIHPLMCGSPWHCQRGAPHGVAVLAPAATPITPLCLHGLNTMFRPCTANERSKCGGIYFNRWRTIFFSSFIRHTAPYQLAEPRAVMWSHQGSAGSVTASSHHPSRAASLRCTSQLWDKTRWFIRLLDVLPSSGLFTI